MSHYIIRRILLMIPTFFLISIAVAGLLRMLPGDIVTMMYGDLGYAASAEELRDKLGINDPFHVQYIQWMGGILTGDFGSSLWSQRPVLTDISWRMPLTVELALLSLLINLAIGVPIGILSAIRQDTWVDHVSRSLAILAIAAPMFWVGTLVVSLPAVWWGWAPPTEYTPFTTDPIGNLKVLTIPALILGFYFQGRTVRLLRAMMLEVTRQDYIRTAWAKGLPEGVIVRRHALKNAMIPVLTLIALEIPFLLGGTVVIEQIFSLPGMGRFVLDLLDTRDFVPIQSIIILMAGVVMVLNLLVDLSYAWLDPRIRYQ